MKLLRLFQILFSLSILCICPVSSWDWLDYVAGNDSSTGITMESTLSLQEIGEMRVRDIKRRLTRTHGYGAEEVGRMLDKQDLIHALAFEEHKIREKKLEQQKRFLVKRGLIAAVVAVLVVLCWPLFTHAYEVAAVNFVVFTDRKKLEFTRCYELQSVLGFVGVLLMSVLDLLQIWLSGSILLSWVMTSNYFFPMPSLAIHPAKFMGGQVASGPMAKYGLNIGPMIVRFGLGFANGMIEKWTGKVLSGAQREQKRKSRENESQQEKEERKARKAARKAAKQAAREQAAEAMASQQQHQQSHAQAQSQPTPTEPQVFDPNPEKEPIHIDSKSVQDFLGQEFDTSEDAFGAPEEEGEPTTSGLDELD